MKHYILGVLLILTACQNEESIACFQAKGQHNYLEYIYADGYIVPLDYPYENFTEIAQAQNDLNDWLNSQENGSLATVTFDFDRNIIVEVLNTSIQFDSMQVGAYDGVNKIVVTFSNCQ